MRAYLYITDSWYSPSFLLCICGGSPVRADADTPATLILQPALVLAPLQGWQAQAILIFSAVNSLAVTDASFCRMFSYNFSSAVYSPFLWETNEKAERKPNTILSNLLAGSQFLLNIATVCFGFNRTPLELKVSSELSGFCTKNFLTSWKQQQETDSSGQNWIIKMRNRMCFWPLNCCSSER